MLILGKAAGGRLSDTPQRQHSKLMKGLDSLQLSLTVMPDPNSLMLKAAYQGQLRAVGETKRFGTSGWQSHYLPRIFGFRMLMLFACLPQDSTHAVK